MTRSNRIAGIATYDQLKNWEKYADPDDFSDSVPLTVEELRDVADEAVYDPTFENTYKTDKVELPNLDTVVYQLGYLQLAAHFAHWQVQGANGPQDHAMFKTLYELAGTLMDTVGEKLVGVHGTYGPAGCQFDAATMLNQMSVVHSNFEGMGYPMELPQAQSGDEWAYFLRSLVIQIMSIIDIVLENNVTSGTENMLQDIQDQLEAQNYFLRQRTPPATLHTVASKLRLIGSKKRDRDDAAALRYIQQSGKVWTQTASDWLYAAAIRLEEDGKVKFIPKKSGNGFDIVPVK